MGRQMYEAKCRTAELAGIGGQQAEVGMISSMLEVGGHGVGLVEAGCQWVEVDLQSLMLDIGNREAFLVGAGSG